MEEPTEYPNEKDARSNPNSPQAADGDLTQSGDSREPVVNPCGSGINRRNFVRLAVAATGLLAGAGGAIGWPTLTAKTNSKSDGVPYRTLGRTGVKVSAIGLGGAHIGTQRREEESIRIIRTALDSGINFLDNCWDYNDGRSEERMGKALRDGYREKAFLMTKIDGRDKATAEKQINESLTRLQTGHIDLMQFHEIIRMDDPSRIFAPGGAMEAMIAAKKAGKVRFIGFTGHKSPDIHLKMLSVAASHDFRFDTVQLPLNVMDAHFNSFEKRVLPLLAKQDIGVLGMKPLGGGIILHSKAVTPIDCLYYALNLPTSVVITGCDSPDVLNQALAAARDFRPMNGTEIAELLAKTARVAQSGKYELYKTSVHFDSTIKHPEYLG